MQVTDMLQIATYLNQQSFEPRQSPSITDRPVEELIAKLYDQGIEVNQDHSEKVVHFTQKRNLQEEHLCTQVPLQTKFPNTSSISTYILRDGNELELYLTNFDNTSSQENHLDPMHTPIGPTHISGNAGILCKVTYISENPDITIMNKIKQALQNTYRPDIDATKLGMALPRISPNGSND